MKLLLGVQDVAYSDEDGVTTTGDVAEILEDEYHVMRVFAETYEGFIGDQVGETIAGAIESMQMGRPTSFSVEGPMNRIEEKFRDFLDRREWELMTGQVIMAAQLGISHRFLSVGGKSLPASKIASGAVKAKGKVLKRNRGPRPAFIDTGLYQASFRAWLAD